MLDNLPSQKLAAGTPKADVIGTTKRKPCHIASASTEQPWARVMSSLLGCVTWAVDLLPRHPGPSRDEDAVPH